VLDSRGNAYALWNSSYAADTASSAILSRDPATGWRDPGTSPGDTHYFGLDVDDLDWLYAITDRQVIVSVNAGRDWALAGRIGLPKTPHCADIRFVRFPPPENTPYLYLSTHGRSVWRANLAEQGGENGLPALAGAARPRVALP